MIRLRSIDKSWTLFLDRDGVINDEKHLEYVNTWDEFKLAFREHYIPEGVLHMKQEEFMRLKQGGDTVMQYLNKFNHLSQYELIK